MTRLAGRKILMILIPVFLLFLLFYAMVSAAYTPSAEDLYYPPGSLSDSIFVGQNNVYLQNEALGKTHSFTTVPYMADIPESAGAKIGSGTVYQVADTVFVYFSEYPDYENIHDIVSTQFPAALLVDYIPEDTKIRMVVDRFGFINGFTAEYIVEYIQVSDGKREMTAVLMGYVLEVQQEYFEGTKMFVGVGTTSYSNERGDSCAAVLDAVMASVRYDKNLAEAILRARPGYTESAVELADGSVTNIPLVIRDNYDTMVLHVSWTQGNPEAVLELFLPNDEAYCDPVEQTGDYAKFVLDNTRAGTYSLRIQNYSACGDILTTIESHVRGEEKSASDE